MTNIDRYRTKTEFDKVSNENRDGDDNERINIEIGTISIRTHRYDTDTRAINIEIGTICN